MADQESRGDNGESCSGEEDSVMRVNLAEGCEAVNDDEIDRAGRRVVLAGCFSV